MHFLSSILLNSSKLQLHTLTVFHSYLQIGAGEFLKIIDDVKGPNSLARQEWIKLEEYMKQFVDAAAIFPPCAIRGDLGAAVTTVGRYLPSILNAGPNALKLTSPFSEVSVCWFYVYAD